MSESEAPVQSPCVGNCCLDDELICLGCFRALDEIKDWSLIDDRARRLILERAAQRKSAQQNRN